MLGISQLYTGSTHPLGARPPPWKGAEPHWRGPHPHWGFAAHLSTGLGSACGTSKQYQHHVATSVFLLLSPSNHKEVGEKKVFPPELVFFQIRGHPDKASARGGQGA